MNPYKLAMLPSAKTCCLLALAPIALSQFSSAAVLAQYTLNETNELTATSLGTGVTASTFQINDQVEDPDGGTLDNDTYQFTADGLLINRKHYGAPNLANNFWFPPSGGGTTTVAAPFQFTITASGVDNLVVDSITMTVTPSSGHVTAAYFGNNNTAAGDYGGAVNFSATEQETRTVFLPSPFTITAGNSRTFYIDLNSNALNSNHLFGTIQVNGLIPEPSAALLGSLGLLALLRRRR